MRSSSILSSITHISELPDDMLCLIISKVRRLKFMPPFAVVNHNGHFQWVAWGENKKASLGTGNEENLISPMPIKITDEGVEPPCITKIFRHHDGNGAHTFFLCENSWVYACGEDTYGQLGIGYHELDYAYRVEPDLVRDVNRVPLEVRDIVIDGTVSFFLLKSGYVCECGEWDTTIYSHPTPITMTRAKAIPKLVCNANEEPLLVEKIFSRKGSTFFLLPNGHVYARGWIHRTQLMPTLICDADEQPLIVKEVVTSDSQTFFLLKNGHVYTCGRDDYGLLGWLGEAPEFVPKLILDENQQPLIVEQLVHEFLLNCRESTTFFITPDHFVYAWGSNWHGQLGVGDVGNQQKPVLVCDKEGRALTVREVIAQGACSTFFLLFDGRIYACGKNGDNQLGLRGDAASKNQPVPVLLTDANNSPFITKQIAVSSNNYGDISTLLLHQDGRLFACGENRDGRLGTGGRIGSPFYWVLIAFSHPIEKIIMQRTSLLGEVTSFVRDNQGQWWACGNNDGGCCGVADEGYTVNHFTKMKLDTRPDQIDNRMTMRLFRGPRSRATTSASASEQRMRLPSVS